MATVNKARYGVDSLGEFELTRFAKCGCCGQGKKAGDAIAGKNLCVVYTHKPYVDAYTAKAKSLLIRNKKTGNFIRTIGINCGCYAKAHRQIAHISSGRSTR